MGKLTWVVTVVLGAAAVFADEMPAEASEADGPAFFDAGFDLDFFSAYVWHNSVQNDEPVLEPCVWADFVRFEPFWLGFTIWQNYDLTSRRHSTLRGGLTETDYNVHFGATAWSDEEGTRSLDLEIGHDWCVNRGVKSVAREYMKNTGEVYAKLTFVNELVDAYGQVNWLYDDFGDYRQGLYYELGLSRKFDALATFGLPKRTLFLGLDGCLSFGDGRYLYYLFGGVGRDVDEFGEETWSNPTAGVGSATLKAHLTWNVTDWMSVVGTVAYSGVLNGSARQALGDRGTGYQGSGYRRDLLWGGLSLKFSF